MNAGTGSKACACRGSVTYYWSHMHMLYMGNNCILEAVCCVMEISE